MLTKEGEMAKDVKEIKEVEKPKEEKSDSVINKTGNVKITEG